MFQKKRQTKKEADAKKLARGEARKVVKSVAEKKQIRMLDNINALGEISLAVPPVNNAHVTGTSLQPSIVNGPNSYNRIGNKIQMTKVEMAITIMDVTAFPAFTGRVRVIILKATAGLNVDNLAAPSDTGTFLLRDITQLRKTGENLFKVKYDRSFRLNNTYPRSIHIKKTFRDKQIVRFINYVSGLPQDYNWAVYAFATSDTNVVSGDTLKADIQTTYHYIDV